MGVAVGACAAAPKAPAPPASPAPPCLTSPPPQLSVVYLHDCGREGYVCVTYDDTAAMVEGVTKLHNWAGEAWKKCGKGGK